MKRRPWPDGVVTLQGLGSGAEYNRVLALIRAGEIKPDPTLVLFSSDGIVHFSRADLIPWFYLSTERVEELLEEFLTKEWP